MLQIDEVKTALNRRVKESLRKDLRAKSWEDKVASISRMNTTARIAKESMRRALEGKAKGSVVDLVREPRELEGYGN